MLMPGGPIQSVASVQPCKVGWRPGRGVYQGPRGGYPTAGVGHEVSGPSRHSEGKDASHTRSLALHLPMDQSVSLPREGIIGGGGPEEGAPQVPGSCRRLSSPPLNEQPERGSLLCTEGGGGGRAHAYFYRSWWGSHRLPACPVADLGLKQARKGWEGEAPRSRGRGSSSSPMAAAGRRLKTGRGGSRSLLSAAPEEAPGSRTEAAEPP